MARSYFRIFVKHLDKMMRYNFYHSMAVRIQRVWRGFRSRKYLHNFVARQRYFDALAVKNKIVRYELEEWRHQAEAERHKEACEAREKSLKREARSKHYLLSTHQAPGVYNSPFAVRSDMEQRIIEAKPKLANLRRVASQPPTRPRDKWDGCVQPDDVAMKAPAKLPPLRHNAKSPQGPFKSREKTHEQRHRAVKLSLRAQTNFYALKEARTLWEKSEDAKMISDKRWVRN